VKPIAKIDVKSPLEGTTLLEAVREMVRLYPTLGHVPNTAQRRIMAPWEKGPYPFMVVSSCGNGTGKTNVVPVDLVGCLCGPEFLNDCWNAGPDGKSIGMTHYRYYHDCRELREKGEFQYRLLCGPEDMKEGGSLYVEIKKYIPTANFKGKTSTGSYKQIEIPLPSNPSVKNYVDIKTFDQEVTTHAGANLHRIGINEPPPYPVFAETISRIRSQKGQVQCTILMNATILDVATWIFDLQDDEFFKGKIVFVQGSIWENCVGEEITQDIADQLEEKLNVVLEKDTAGHYLTYGHLTRSSIENQIHFFERTDPNQIEARIWGANTQTFGAEFKTFNINIHVCPSRVIPRNVPVFQVVDPHPVKPDLAGYFFVDHLGRKHWFEEWPHLPWEKLSSRNKTIAEICAEWTALESRLGISDQVVTRIGDPNRFMTADSRDNLALWALYVPHGFSFNCFVRDNLEFGHQQIHSALYFDKRVAKTDPSDILAQPGMDFTSNCENLINSCKFYGRKARKDVTTAVNESIDKKYKDGMDIIRYGTVFTSGKTFDELCGLKSIEGDDYSRIRKSREDYDGPYEIPKERLKGRRFVSFVGAGA
jgi:hypothetical protein